MRPDNDPAETAAREAGLDDTLAQTFPASDPPSSIPNPCEYELVNAAGGEDEGRRDYGSGRALPSR